MADDNYLKLFGTLSPTNPIVGFLASAYVRGYSAYEIAVQNGFEGTIEEWLLSLIGPKGDKGDKGNTGDIGPVGPAGNGIQRVRLESDYSLTIYFTNGAYVNLGSIRGEKGEKGEKGDKGDKGGQGEPGKDGADGVSPIARIVDTPGGAMIYVTDVRGTTYAQIFDGAKGDKGDKGDTYALTQDDKNEIADIVELAIINDYVETVTGSTPVINAKAGVRYICGEVATLNFMPSENGISDVLFISGSTPTILTIPSTVKWTNGFDPTDLDANTTYKLNILDGIYGMALAWT